ncbi:MAG: hypothetical protein AAFZ58_00575 [Pseudomonadota bacterium]
MMAFASSAYATAVTPGVYFLLDHPDGAISPPPYGLRTDILSPPAGQGPTFSVETGAASVTLTWNGGTTATIAGTLYNNETGNLWTVTHDLTGVTVVGGPNGGFFATAGVLTLDVPMADQGLYGAAQFTFISELKDGMAFTALGDDYRCGSRPDCGPLVGRGWVEQPGAQNSTDDWLVQLTPVPVPAAVWLLLSGLGLLRVVRRRA